MGACATKEGAAFAGQNVPHDLQPSRSKNQRLTSTRKRDKLASLVRRGNSIQLIMDEVVAPQEHHLDADNESWAVDCDEDIKVEPINPSVVELRRAKTREEPEGELEPEKEPEREPSSDDVSMSRPTVPDFSGSWVCSRVEGDWDGFLKEAGISWTLRKTISSMAYGVGRQVQDISQTEEQISVKNVVHSFPPREALCVYKLDGLPEEVVDLEGQRARCVSYWDKGVLVTEQQTADSSKPLPTVRRSMAGEDMCTVRVSPGGLEVKRFYSRC